MADQIKVGDISVEVIFKDIKNVHLSVYPPTGRVRIAAPTWMSLATIRLYTIAKLEWIKKQQNKLQEQERETPREYLDRESHYIWGRRYLLHVNEGSRTHSVEIKHSQMVLNVRAGTGREKREAVMAAWYREQVREAMLPFFEKWEVLLGVKVGRIYIQRMKTRWGSCNPRANSIRLNSELAKKPRECLEYVIVHELMHLIEPSHNGRFISLMDRFLPNWKHLRNELNRAPLGHVDWEY